MKDLPSFNNWDSGIRIGCKSRVQEGVVTLERIIWTNAEISNLQMEHILISKMR